MIDNWTAEIDRMPGSPLQVFQAYWQPIETAPKDGTVILVYVQTGRGESWTDVCRYDEQSWFSGLSIIKYPTHWMPVPAPPASE